MKQVTFTTKNNITLTIREALVTDAQIFIDYMRKIAHESDNLSFGPDDIPPTLEEEKTFIKNAQNKDNHLILMAFHEDKLVACLTFRGIDRSRVKHKGEFGISVLREYWRMGIAKKLILTLIDWGKSTGFLKKINLKVKEDNIGGITLYESLGFKKEGHASMEFYANGRYYGAYLMGLEI